MKFISRFPSFATASAALCIAFSLLTVGAQNAPQPETHGIVIANMDRSVIPGDNFYLYTNGEWIKRTVIPPDRAGVSVFSFLDDLSNKRTAALIQDAAQVGRSCWFKRAQDRRSL